MEEEDAFFKKAALTFLKNAEANVEKGTGLEGQLLIGLWNDDTVVKARGR